ncbi:TIGR03619 family F420-dependent LLM class oxidoreductase [Actinomadura sp. 7K534]|uniref:TIGR03619 family F420-dependent LLM class oxidoreductase n=1 Tax=Actinomadura sp. 7K534 TaxID=2530366 RepID=UPI001047CCCB|nr:TIGR03619 family F420-dependent LLM class oxidoreductase [Actinomadura sp. 7K534]TDB85859.1 TIGR03619 family F420-dependent LLM class oxidoreductase [Actinomadura sp. 7K534]
MAPTLGLFAVNLYACAEPDAAARIAALAEDLGYDSVWTADHVVLPSPRVDASPLDPDAPVLDPLVALAHLAAHTERIALGTGIIVLPQRNPLVLAKQLASIDVLSKGRLIFGTAVGYLEPELRAIGVPPAERGARTDEYLAAIRSLWYDEKPSFHGRYADFAGVDAHPRPVQRPVPVVTGGHSPAALRRAARHADGWYGWMLGRRAAAELVPRLAEQAAQAGPARRGRPPLHVSVTPPRAPDEEHVRAYGELGVDRLIIVPPLGAPLAEVERFVERHAPRRVGARVAE